MDDNVEDVLENGEELDLDEPQHECSDAGRNTMTMEWEAIKAQAVVSSAVDMSGRENKGEVEVDEADGVINEPDGLEKRIDDGMVLEGWSVPEQL